MSTFEQILRKIEDWDLDGACRDLERQLDLSDSQMRQLDKIYREYRDVDENIQDLRRKVITEPEAVLLGLEQLFEIKATHPDYQRLLGETKQKVDQNQRANILERIAEAEELSREAKSYSEAQQMLEAIRAEYPTWAADAQVKERINQVDDEAKKAEKANLLVAGILQDIKSGKPEEGNERLTQLALLGKVDPEEINEYRTELSRLSAHKQARSSKETRDFSDTEYEFDFEISKVERSVDSIQNASSYSHRLLYNNQILRESIYSDAINKLGKTKGEVEQKISELALQLKDENDTVRKESLGHEILVLRNSLPRIEEKILLIEAKRKEVNELLPKTEVDARKQIEEIVDEALDDAQVACQSGKLEMALFFLDTAVKAGLKEEYDDPRLTDHLGTLPLSPEQSQRVHRIQSEVQERQAQRQVALAKKEAAQRQLASPNLTLKQLEGILVELRGVLKLDKDTPGLTNAILYLEGRIARESHLLKQQYKLRVSLLCQKGLVDESQRAYLQALDMLGNDPEIQGLEDLIKNTQAKIQHLEKVAEEFQAGFRLAREELIVPDANLHALLAEWKKDGFDTALIVSADSRFQQYLNGLAEVKEQIARLENGLLSGEPLTGLQDASEFLRQCFLKSESRVQELLARYWQAVANQHRDKDQLREEEYLQDALGYAENSNNQKLVQKIKLRLGELQGQTELGRKARDLEETLLRYKENNLARALQKIAELSADNPLRANHRIARLIDDIEFEGKYKLATDHYQNAKELFKQGEHDAALAAVMQALEILPSYFEAAQLLGEIKVAKADEEPLSKRIADALSIGAEEDKKLTGSQVKQLEETNFLVDQLDGKSRVSIALMAQKSQFKSYYRSWHDRVAGIVNTAVENAQLQSNTGDFDAAGQILETLREYGIPFDLLVSVSQAENGLKSNRSQSIIIERMIETAAETAGEGKYGIDKAISLLTSLKSAPGFIRPRIDKQLELFKKAQNDFGKITEDVSKVKVLNVINVLEENKKAKGQIEFDLSIINARNCSNELQNHINALREMKIKDSNELLKATIDLQKIIDWYSTSVDVLLKDRQPYDYKELVNSIKDQERLGEEIKQNLSPSMPQSQRVLAAIHDHIALLDKMKQNQSVFADVHQKTTSFGGIGWPSKGFWQSLRYAANSVLEMPHVEPDEKKRNNLVRDIDQKETKILRNFYILAFPSGIIILCIVSSLMWMGWTNVVAPTYFPSPTITPSPTNTPLPTLTASATPVPSITPRPTITPTPTPLPVMVRIMWNQGAPVYLYPGVFRQIYKLEAGSDVNVQSYCVREEEYWGMVITPDDYGWILLSSRDATGYYDFVNADVQAGLRKRAVNVVMDGHPELLVSCPVQE